MTEEEDRSPKYQSDGFDCPHCGIWAHQHWGTLQQQTTGNTGSGNTEFQAAFCTKCGGRSLWTVSTDTDDAGAAFEVGEMIYPSRSKVGPKPPRDLPEDLVKVYEEARSVTAVSPRAAAALLRLTLEGLLADQFPNAKDLNKAIGEASKSGLTSEVTDAMDVLRFSGNEAVHEIRNEDNEGTVTSLYGVVALSVDQLISQKRRIRDMFERMPDTVRKAIQDRNKKP